MADWIDKEGDAARAKLEGRKRLFEQGIEMLRLVGSAGGVAVGAGLRTMMPVLEAYSGTRITDLKAAQDDVAGDEQDNFFELTPEQLTVVKKAGAKATIEMIEITSITHPVYEGAEPYAASGVNGQRQTPHMRHLFSLFLAGKDYFNFGDDEVPEQYPDIPETAFNEQNAVAYMAVAPGEYIQSPGPLTPTQTRRAAMRQRSFTQPQPAMLSTNNQPIAQPIAMGYTSQAMTRSQVVPITAAQPMVANNRFVSAPALASPMPQQTCGCGGGSNCGCGCGGGQGRRQFAPARYEFDGSCAPTGTISCDTRWRIRECFKIAFCDMLRCLADEVCEDGRLAEEPNADACLEGFICSLLHCLPDAICPPPEKETCCPTDPDSSCNCNFAVGE